MIGSIGRTALFLLLILVIIGGVNIIGRMAVEPATKVNGKLGGFMSFIFGGS